MNMTVTTLKEQLHAYINSADKNKLEAMYTLLLHPIESEYEFTEADKKMLNKRKSSHLKGESKSYSVSEVRKYAVSKLVK